MENKFLRIKKWTGEGGKGAYYYAERLGKDSVAFILQDETAPRVGLVREFKPPINDFVITAFGGSLDKNEEMEEIVRREAKEESGYTAKYVKYVGRCFVSTQMNQWCYLYIVGVDSTETREPAPENEIEKMSSLVWMPEDEVKYTDCWKAITIATKEEF